MQSSLLQPLFRARRARPVRARRALLASTVCVAVSLAAVGCGNQDAGAPSAGGTPGSGGTMTMTVPGEAASFDPARTSMASVGDGNRLAAVYDALVVTDPTTGTVRAKVAESLQPEDGTGLPDRWVLRIRPNVRFSDGLPYDAAAVKTNWERHRDPRTRSYLMTATLAIKALDVDPKDPLVLRITLNGPNANFDRIVSKSLAYNASPAALRPETVEGLRSRPVGAGPFTLQEWVPNQRQVFVRNPQYWQRGRGLPYLEQLVMRVDADLPRSARELGKVSDFTISVDPENIRRTGDRGLGVVEIALNGGAMVLFNLAHGPFRDVRARRAVALALDSDTINDTFYSGSGKPANGIFSASSPLANPQLLAGQNEPEAAQRLFDEVTENGTKPLDFTYVVPQSPTTAAVTRHMQARLNTFRGVRMKIVELDIPTFIRTVRGGSDAWAISMYQLWLDDPDPGIYDFVRGDSLGNYSGYRNPDVDRALEEARASTDQTARRAAYTRVQLRLNTDVPFWVYQEAVAAALFSSKVTGVRLVNDGIVEWDEIGLRR